MLSRHTLRVCDIFLMADYWAIWLATAENTLFALPPIRRTVPITITSITASITAYSAMSCPSSLRHESLARSFILDSFELYGGDSRSGRALGTCHYMRPSFADSGWLWETFFHSVSPHRRSSSPQGAQRPVGNTEDPFIGRRAGTAVVPPNSRTSSPQRAQRPLGNIGNPFIGRRYPRRDGRGRPSLHRCGDAREAG